MKDFLFALFFLLVFCAVAAGGFFLGRVYERGHSIGVLTASPTMTLYPPIEEPNGAEIIVSCNALRVQRQRAAQ